MAFCLHTAYLLPLTALTLLVAVGALGFRAGRRRGYGPLAAGSVAAALVVVGKFALGWTALAYGGVALLAAASVWNSWPVQRGKTDLVPLGTGEAGSSD